MRIIHRLHILRTNLLLFNRNQDLLEDLNSRFPFQLPHLLQLKLNFLLLIHLNASFYLRKLEYLNFYPLFEGYLNYYEKLLSHKN